MDLKELIKEVERLKSELTALHNFQLQGIKQTVEAVDNLKEWDEIDSVLCNLTQEDRVDWETLKKLLGLK